MNCGNGKAIIPEHFVDKTIILYAVLITGDQSVL